MCACSVMSTLCDPMNCSLPSSSVHGISQARILEWIAIILLQGIFPTYYVSVLPKCILICNYRCTFKFLKEENLKL